MNTMNKKEKMILMNNMSSNLSLLRTKIGLSQNELADLVGLTRQTISSLETGQRKMTWSVFLALILIFFRNEPTKKLLVALNIYTPELNKYLNISKTDIDNKSI